MGCSILAVRRLRSSAACWLSISINARQWVQSPDLPDTCILMRGGQRVGSNIQIGARLRYVEEPQPDRGTVVWQRCFDWTITTGVFGFQ